MSAISTPYDFGVKVHFSITFCHKSCLLLMTRKSGFDSNNAGLIIGSTVVGIAT